MQDRRPTTQKRLMKEFPQINADVVEEIDIKIKTKVLAYQSNIIEIYLKRYRKK